LKQGDALSSLVSNIALEYDIGRVQANQEGLKLNGTHQHLVYADDVTILCESIPTTKKNTEALLVASKEIGLKVNAGKTKYMFMSHEQNAGQNHDIKITTKYFEVVEQLKYLGTVLTNQPILVAARSKAGVCGHSLAGIAGMKPAGGMDVCLLLV
jgi:hypothetical protein